jgi:hypothetical protein
MSILMTSDVTGFFREAVGEAFASHHAELSTGVREYLVGILVDFTARGSADSALDRPVTLLLNEALQAPPAERFERLKGLGDSSLYVSGLFQDHLEARGVDVGYVSSVGATAYGSAATLLTRGDGPGLDLFGELAARFRLLVAVLHEVADRIFAAGTAGPGGVLKLYDRWRKTGSERLGRELLALGLVPVRGAGGLQ